MRQADQSPFATYLGHPAQQEPAEAPRLLDLAEDRLDDRLPPRVDRTARGRLQLRAHLLRGRRRYRRCGGAPGQVAGAARPALAAGAAVVVVASWCRCRSVAMC